MIYWIVVYRTDKNSCGLTFLTESVWGYSAQPHTPTICPRQIKNIISNWPGWHSGATYLFRSRHFGQACGECQITCQLRGDRHSGQASEAFLQQSTWPLYAFLMVCSHRCQAAVGTTFQQWCGHLWDNMPLIDWLNGYCNGSIRILAPCPFWAPSWNIYSMPDMALIIWMENVRHTLAHCDNNLTVPLRNALCWHVKLMTVVTIEVSSRTSGPMRRTGHLGRSNGCWPIRPDASSSQRSYNIKANYMLACHTDSVKMNIWTEAAGTGRFTPPRTGQFVTAFIQGKQQITSRLADNI